MPVINETQLKQKLRNDIRGIYLIFGEESYLKRAYVSKISSKATDGAFEDFNKHDFDGKETSVSEIYECAGAVPMMAEYKCIIVKDFPFDDLDDKGFVQLEQLLSENPEHTVLVFTTVLNTPKGAKWNKALKLFSKYGSAVEFARKTVSETVKILESGAKKRGCIFEKGSADYLVNSVGSDLNTLLNELEKICAYSNDGVIKKSDIDAVCIKSLDARVFDMIKDLVAGRFESAFKKLNVLFEQREDEFLILGALISTYADIYRAKAAIKSSERAEAAAKFYDYKGKEFRLSNAARNSSSLSFEDIYESIEILAWADNCMKSTSTDNKLILEQTLIKLARLNGR